MTRASPSSFDLAIIGAGPAGLAAGTLAAQLGLVAVVLDEQQAAGGQIYRAIEASSASQRARLGEDYARGMALIEAFKASKCAYMPEATAWAIQRDDAQPDRFEIATTVRGNARLLHVRAVILATGALERASPIPGWTLPGVMTAGAAQALLKASSLLPRGRTVLAGSGPLLYLLAGQLLDAGARIEALLDTTPKGRMLRALAHVAPFVASPYFGKGVKLVRRVRRRVPVIRHAFALAAEGSGRVQRIRYRSGRRERAIDCDLLLLHQGVVPNVNLARAIGCAHEWDPVQRCFRPRVDAWGRSSIEGIGIAGDGAGIAGAVAAEHSGALATLAAAHALGVIDEARRDALAREPRETFATLARPRRFFDVLFAPARAFRVPDDDTIVCRCEAVTARSIRKAAAAGCTGPNQLKAFLRCGMGRCQGRLCGLVVTEVIADARGISPARVGYFRLRPPVKPVTLGELASLPQSEAARRAVIRLAE